MFYSSWLLVVALIFASTTQAQESVDRTTYHNVLIAHGVMGPVAFVLFYPLGAMYIRLWRSSSNVWVHAGWMAFTYVIVLAHMALGIWMAVVSQQIDTYHAIIGLVVAGALLAQPITGLAHHILYKKRGRPNAATYPHVWWGRAVITLGIINGGLGLQLSGNTTKGEIGYGVVAGFMWLLWMGVIFIAFLRSRGKPEGETGEKIFPPKDSFGQGDYDGSHQGPVSSNGAMTSNEDMERGRQQESVSGSGPLPANGTRRF